MKIKEFKYTKKSNGEIKEYKLLVLNEGDSHISGIDLNKLTPEEMAQIIKIQQDYETKLKPFMTSFRQFIKENIVE